MVQVLSIGIAVLDEIFTIPESLVPGAKHRARRVETVIGGNAASASLAIARLGGRASLIARLGGDPAGEAMRLRLEASGVDTSLSHAVPGSATARSSILIEPNGNRTIVNYLDPDLPDLPGWLPARLPGNTRAVQGDTRWEAGARHLFTLALEKGVPAVFDGDRMPVDTGLIDLATHSVFSAQGLAEMTGTANIPEGLRRMVRNRSGFFAATDGENGVFAIEGGAIRHYPAFPITPVDTLAAGDVWHGAFALALGEGRPTGAAIRFASAVAAIKCTRPGGSSGTPHRREVEDFLAQNSEPAPASGR